jgi:hypothetical protein
LYSSGDSFSSDGFEQQRMALLLKIKEGKRKQVGEDGLQHSTNTSLKGFRELYFASLELQEDTEPELLIKD